MDDFVSKPADSGLSLQDLGDLRQLSTACSALSWWKIPLCDCSIYEKTLKNAIDTVKEETMAWAWQHEADGRYRDAEYLFRRASSNKKLPEEYRDSYPAEHVLPTLVSLYEQTEDYPAAEITQETLLRHLFADDLEQVARERSQAVTTYSKLLFQSRKRILDVNPRFNLEISANQLNSLVAYRVAVLDIPLLNEISLDQSLIVLKPPGDPHCTLLHVAAKQNAINLAALLIAKGADVNSRDLYSCTPLHVAAQFAEIAMVELLLAKGAETGAENFSGASPLHAALRSDSVEEMLALLIKAGADVEARDKGGKTALFIAVRYDLPAAALVLLEHRASTEAFDKNAETPLLFAARNGTQWAIKLLLEKGANLEARRRSGKTALCNAVEEDHEPIVQILLDRGAVIKTAVHQPNNNFHRSLLYIAITNARVSIVDMLLRAGADIHQIGYRNNTALHQAVLGGQEPHEQIMQLLLTHSAPLDAVNRQGETVFHYAVRFKRRNMMLILLRHILPNKLSTICKIRDTYVQTPLDLARNLAKHASESSDERSILFLLESALKLSHTYT